MKSIGFFGFCFVLLPFLLLFVASSSANGHGEMALKEAAKENLSGGNNIPIKNDERIFANYHIEYIDYKTDRTQKQIKELVEELARTSKWNLIKRNRLENAIMDNHRYLQELAARLNAAKKEVPVYVELPLTMPYSEGKVPIPYNPRQPELKYIAYEIGRAKMEQKALEDELAKTPKWNLVKRNRLQTQIMDKERAYQEYVAELYTVVKERKTN